MLLFLLRGTFWLAIVAIALPWFVTGREKDPSVASTTMPPAAMQPMIAAREKPQAQFDDVTGSVANNASGCADDCDAAPKVDLIAMQLSAAKHAAAPAGTSAPPRARTTAAGAGSSKPAPRRVAARRPVSIGDLLAR